MGLSIYIGHTKGFKLLENTELLSALINGSLLNDEYLRVILSTLAGYGPLSAAIFIYFYDKNSRVFFNRKFRLAVSLKYVLEVIGLFSVITIIPSIILMFINNSSININIDMFSFLIFFFVYQFTTAGSEEVGWRGYLLPSLLKTKTAWQASVIVGVIWALWHSPIVLYVFYSQGMLTIQIISSFIGFIAGTIAMSTIHTYYYLKTKSVLFNIFIHAISNTIPMFVGMIFANTFEISVIVQILLWGFVFFITKRNTDMFDKKPL